MATEPPAWGTETPTVHEFLRTVLRSGIVDRDGLRAALHGLPKDSRDSAAAVADHLVKGGVLSRFQARRLLRGIAVGLVLGPYQLLAPLGKGGMGTVFMARDERSGQLVALKVLPPRRARKEERAVARFVREMAVSTRVSHPHLAWTHEAGQCQGVLYIAMEYIPGKTMARVVHGQGPMEPRRAARLIAEAASGLEHAHNMGLVHRDLKPSNIMVTPHDHAKVLDLGLALVEGEQIEDHEVVGGQGYVLGTMDYISPEQTTDAAAVDRRSDIYAMGCTLYFALTGQPPFPGGTNREKIRRHRGDEPVPVEQLRPEVPLGLAEVVRRMMAKDPARRYQSAIEVAEALGAWAREEEALPLDRPEDSSYAQAVDELRKAEVSGDFSLPPVPTPGEADEPVASELPDVPPPQRRGWPVWLIALMCALGLWLAGLAALALVLRGVTTR
jgi:serine/threonine protein kinase